MRHFVLIFAGLLIPSCAGAQTACRGLHESMLTGTVRDSTEALIPGAMLTLDNGRTTTSMADGRFRFACVADGTHQLAAEVEGFAPAAIAVKVPQRGELALLLKLKSVQTSVTVNAGDQALPDTNSTGASTTLAGKQLQSLADDPDDLLRELQQLGALTGGDPANTVITVDGYQGSSKLPPKSAIAYIKVNPDLYSAEYHMPPYDGGRVEVYTKPASRASTALCLPRMEARGKTLVIPSPRRRLLSASSGMVLNLQVRFARRAPISNSTSNTGRLMTSPW